ncbi:hypothetical protein CC86DRAFT_386618 [Ophiobolus disseminans]|uniref:Uncharacterized protein n=1 Tax=Ophiobolus disseminans TaxID=1469910 RepID=A0A6A6ZJ58_9PLEO|nr:hypothetical protein CC86DRAFT_386618 [Ophiobolus disseminans]
MVGVVRGKPNARTTRSGNPTDKTKCIKCPPLTKPDPTKTLCIKDDDANKEDKKKQYEDKIKKKIKEKFNKFKEKIKERLEKKKEKKSKEWEEKDKKRQDKRNQKKFRRMAVCSPAVAAAIGTTAMLELADGGFSEDLFDSIDSDMLEFWPRNEIDDDFLDKTLPDDESDITKEEYVNEFLEVGDAASGNLKRSIEKRTINGTVEMTLENIKPAVEKRGLFDDIAKVLAQIGRAIASLARSRAGKGGAVGKPTKYFSEGKKPTLKKPGESKFTRAQQKDKAKEISQNKNWKNCLRGEKPQK